MPAYYNEESKKWYCKFYYKDWQGNRKQKKKSGFERKKDALEWERSFLDKLSGSPDMAFSDMVELYLEDKKKHVKLKTYCILTMCQFILYITFKTGSPRSYQSFFLCHF